MLGLLSQRGLGRLRLAPGHLDAQCAPERIEHSDDLFQPDGRLSPLQLGQESDSHPCCSSQLILAEALCASGSPYDVPDFRRRHFVSPFPGRENQRRRAGDTEPSINQTAFPNGKDGCADGRRQPGMSRTGQSALEASRKASDLPERENRHGWPPGDGLRGAAPEGSPRTTPYLANVCEYFTSSARPDDNGRLGPSPSSRMLLKPSL